MQIVQDVDISYSGVHQLVRYRLKSQLKVPRPTHIKQEKSALQEFKKLGKQIKSTLPARAEQVKKYPSVRYWCGDEARVGLITLGARKITSKGVGPIGIEQWCCDYLWLYGLVEPKTGDSFFTEFSHVDGNCSTPLTRRRDRH